MTLRFNHDYIHAKHDSMPQPLAHPEADSNLLNILDLESGHGNQKTAILGAFPPTFQTLSKYRPLIPGNLLF
jgi:hypothetical protein